ncbi:hypothetical protein RO3G_03158 [Rhizopus delemar RA 99-880]|uniref:Peptidase M13 N-terminal domain-containing protein n=1 Tax=Rhizopus delemar (strain RA 99-880 / ATCC MYA-4621 / FGSC 9543 / NRRL 43880) TaxID=246409 RepID=I1BQH4_RHIO9|nr:hypothetical protein RO3G_03158 [Rhizopus delemar RA 99-880]|eukprot:EIE78454.1 hypothetical protein RO3G_03158 [Rhizopus delemar RA 99-880]
MMDLASSVLGSKNSTERDQNRIKLMEEIGMETLSNPELYAMVDSTVSLQERLVELAGSISDYDRHTYTVDEAKDEFAFIDWTGILASSIPQIIDTSNISIQVYNIEYFKELSYYANIDDPTRPIHKDAIANHFMIYKIATEASKLDSELRQIIPDSTFQTRSSICIEKVLERFGLAAGRFYSMITFGGESDKARLEAMATNIKRALIKRIQNADWLDISTKNSATKKVC